MKVYHKALGRAAERLRRRGPARLLTATRSIARYRRGTKDTEKMKRCVRCGSAAGEAETCPACREFFRELGRAGKLRVQAIQPRRNTYLASRRRGLSR